MESPNSNVLILTQNTVSSTTLAEQAIIVGFEKASSMHSNDQVLDQMISRIDQRLKVIEIERHSRSLVESIK